jgi:hypothetical protein
MLLARGVIVDWYPYLFVNPHHSGGYLLVAGDCGGRDRHRRTDRHDDLGGQSASRCARQQPVDPEHIGT